MNIGKVFLYEIFNNYPVCFYLDVDQIGKNQYGKLMIKIRNLGLLDTNMCESLLPNSSFSENFDTLSLHQSDETYNFALLVFLDQASPAEIKIIKHRSEQPWFTLELRTLKRKKQILERKYKKQKVKLT